MQKYTPVEEHGLFQVIFFFKAYVLTKLTRQNQANNALTSIIFNTNDEHFCHNLFVFQGYEDTSKLPAGAHHVIIIDYRLSP